VRWYASQARPSRMHAAPTNQRRMLIWNGRKSSVVSRRSADRAKSSSANLLMPIICSLANRYQGYNSCFQKGTPLKCVFAIIVTFRSMGMKHKWPGLENTQHENSCVSSPWEEKEKRRASTGVLVQVISIITWFTVMIATRLKNTYDFDSTATSFTAFHWPRDGWW